VARRVLEEGRLLARVRHPNVIAVYGADVRDGRVGLWMEFVEGETLEGRLHREGPLSAREALLVGIELCGALAAVHQAGVVHRDVKAQNVMREAGGRLVLMDFGAGEESTPRGGAFPSFAGTPLYLAPEMFFGEAATPQSDIYSVGVLLHHLVTGGYPMAAQSLEELRAAHRAGRRTLLRDARPDLPGAFVDAVERALTPSPNARFLTVGEMAGALEDALRPAPSSGGAAVSTAPVNAASRYGIATVLVAIVAIAATIGIATWAATTWRRHAMSTRSIRSVAVLPFVNVSKDPRVDYVVEGLTHEIATTLGSVRDLRVISTTSTMRYKASRERLPDIAKALGVDAVLEGAVTIPPPRASGFDPADRTRITMKLIHAGTDTQLWTARFSEPTTNVLSLDTNIAGAVAEQLDRQLGGERQRERQHSAVPEAQDAYLRASALMHTRHRDRLSEAAAELRRAVTIDPKYALAHARLAYAYVLLESYGVVATRDAFAGARKALEAATALEPDLPDAEFVRAELELVERWDWSTSEAGYRRALALNPSYAEARERYAMLLAAQGWLDDALREARRAEELNPVDPAARSTTAVTLYYRREYDAAIRSYRAALALDPNYSRALIGIGRAFAEKRQFDDALAALDRGIVASGGVPAFVAEAARVLAAAGRRRDAMRRLQALQEQARRANMRVAPHSLAYIHAALGEPREAFKQLESAVAQREPGVLWAKVDPRFDPLRTQPEFPAFIRSLGLQP
jgi:TolB-like protein/Tfp pilus assembly protein PilF